MDNELFFTDVGTETLEYVGDSEKLRSLLGSDSTESSHNVGDTDIQQLTTDATNDVSAGDLDTVTLDSPWNDFFDTDEYVQFEATVAQPIVQPYFYDGELRRFRKTESELKQAQAQIENLPWTVEHPPEDRITTADQIRGFWSDPEYDDGQQATLQIPYTDTDAIRFAIEHGEISVGFSGTLDWSVTDEMVDADQRDMAYDHIASVKNGRCPPEEGCQLHVDDASHHGHVSNSTDGVQTKLTEEDEMHGDMNPKFSEGDWVEWNWSDGTAIGRIKNVSTDRPLSTSGTTRDPSEGGEPVYKARHWDDGEWGNDKVAYESNLSSTNAPSDFTDNINSLSPLTCSALCSPGSCSCGLHDPFNDVTVNGEDIDGADSAVGVSVNDGSAERAIDLVPPEAVQNNAQDALDAREDDDVTVNGMTEHGWSRAEQLASGEELSPSDIVGSSGAMAPWWSRHAQYSISGGEQASLQGADKDNPWEDNSYTSGKGWGGVAGWKWAIRKGNEIKRARDEEPTYEVSDSLFTAINVADTTIADTITYDGLMGGQLDESEIPNDDYEDHYVFDADTKTDSSYPLVDANGNLRRGNVKAAWEVYGSADDEQLLLDVLAQANNRFANADGFTAPIDSDSLQETIAEHNDTMTETLNEFIDENDLTFEDVIDALDLADSDAVSVIVDSLSESNNVDLDALDSVPNEPTDFYDGEPSIEDLADDFSTVQMLADEKESLEDEVATLTDELRETKRPTYEEKVEELVEIADDAFGSEDELLDAFDAEDDSERLTIDDLDEKIERAKTIKGTETTTTADSDSSDGADDDDTDVESSMVVADEDTIETTDSGRLNLSSVRE